MTRSSLVTVTAGLVLAGALLAGCATPAAPAPAPAATGATPPSASDTRVLPWPVSGPADAAALQESVDSGAQPWLLDPTEVALSYVAATRGWDGAGASPRAGGTSDLTVDVRAGTELLTLTLRQPGRTGPGGIWVVTAEVR